MSKKVLFFCAALGDGGAERVVITLLRNIDRKRIRPHLALSKKVGVWLEHVPEDVPVIDLGASRLAFSTQRLVDVLKREKPDILFSVSTGPNQIASLAHRIASDPKRRLVFTERSTYSLVRQRKPKWLPVRTVASRLYQQADSILTVSDGVAEDLVRSLRVRPERVETVYNPIVSDELFEASREPADHPWFESDIPVLLAVGRLVPMKDYPTLLRAFAMVRSKRAARLFILGEGNLRGDLERQARDLSIVEDVCFAGFRVNPFPYMRACTAFVMSSRLEGLPGALIQALACGAPVVSTDCPSGPSEIIEPGRNGFLVPVGDADAMATALSQLLDDELTRKRMASYAPQSVARFGVDVVVRRYETALLGM